MGDEDAASLGAERLLIYVSVIVDGVLLPPVSVSVIVNMLLHSVSVSIIVDGVLLPPVSVSVIVNMLLHSVSVSVMVDRAFLYPLLQLFPFQFFLMLVRDFSF